MLTPHPSEPCSCCAIPGEHTLGDHYPPATAGTPADAIGVIPPAPRTVQPVGQEWCRCDWKGKPYNPNLVTVQTPERCLILCDKFQIVGTEAIEYRPVLASELHVFTP